MYLSQIRRYLLCCRTDACHALLPGTLEFQLHLCNRDLYSFIIESVPSLNIALKLRLSQFSPWWHNDIYSRRRNSSPFKGSPVPTPCTLRSTHPLPEYCSTYSCTLRTHPLPEHCHPYLLPVHSLYSPTPEHFCHPHLLPTRTSYINYVQLYIQFYQHRSSNILYISLL